MVRTDAILQRLERLRLQMLPMAAQACETDGRRDRERRGERNRTGEGAGWRERGGGRADLGGGCLRRHRSSHSHVLVGCISKEYLLTERI
jgi:hypothetical protein